MSEFLLSVYKRKNYRIYDTDKGYIVHNTKYSFKDHNVFFKNFDTCKYIINLSLNHIIPKNLSEYLLFSLITLSDDEEYKCEIRKILNKKKGRKKNEK